MEEEIEEAEEREVTKEHEFDFKQFLRTFSSPKVVKVYSLLLTLYRTNEVYTNHCIVKMLHRIAVQVDLYVLITLLVQVMIELNRAVSRVPVFYTHIRYDNRHLQFKLLAFLIICSFFQNGMVAFLFQLSLFRTFQKIFRDDCTKAPQFTEIKKFSQFVIYQFFKCAQKVPK